jgi:hypothetical protein
VNALLYFYEAWGIAVWESRPANVRSSPQADCGGAEGALGEMEGGTEEGGLAVPAEQKEKRAGGVSRSLLFGAGVQ